MASTIDSRGQILESLRFEDECVFLSGKGASVMTLATLAHRAHSDRVDLGARGFYWTPVDSGPPF